MSRSLLVLLSIVWIAAPAVAQEEVEGEVEGEVEVEVEVEEPSPLALARMACALENHVECLELSQGLIEADHLAAELPLLRAMRLGVYLAQGQVEPARIELETLDSERRADWSLIHAGDEALLADADRQLQEGFLTLAQVDYAEGRFEEAYFGAVRAADAREGTLQGRLACELAIHVTRRMGRAGHDGIWTDRRLDSLDRFVTTFPEDFMAQDMLLESGELMSAMGLHEDAVPRLEGVVLADPTTPAAVAAASILMSSLQADRDWAGLHETAQQLLAMEDFGTPELRQRIADASERARFHLIEAQHVRAEDWLGAAEAFQAFAELNPDSDLADRALYNAIVFYYKAGRSPTASHLAKVLRRKFPHSPYIDRLQL